MESFPQKIFFVRHSEREDHVDPNIGRSSPRPHDCSITKSGKALANKLGSYMIGGRWVDPKDVVIISSPLQRCVQTGHAIAEGLVQHLATTPDVAEKTLRAIPIFIEPGLVEGVYWMHNDIRRNKAIAGCDYPPSPIYQSVEYLRRNISFLVQHQKSPHLEASGGFLGPAPIYSVNENGLLAEEVDVKERCRHAAVQLVTNGAYAGKTVICVGHGQTSLLWFNAIASDPIAAMSPDYTAVAELMPAPVNVNDQDCVQWFSQIQPFTQPHLGTQKGDCVHARPPELDPRGLLKKRVASPSKAGRLFANAARMTASPKKNAFRGVVEQAKVLVEQGALKGWTISGVKETDNEDE